MQVMMTNNIQVPVYIYDKIQEPSINCIIQIRKALYCRINVYFTIEVYRFILNNIEQSKGIW